MWEEALSQAPEHLLALTAIFLAFSYVAGLLHAAHAVMTARSPEGAIAWALSLVFIPVLSVPMYWIFGRNKFEDYAEVMRETFEINRKSLESVQKAISSCSGSEPPGLSSQSRSLLESIAIHPFTGGNSLKLLLDGEAAFKSIFEAIDSARECILVEYYIFRCDAIGTEFRDRLIAKAREGVRVHFIYDEFGSGSLPDPFVEAMRAAGIEVSEFGAPKRAWGHLRLNFRNHRKIVVVDGRTAFLGGMNVGDEYLSRDPEMGLWHDAHLRIEGPAALAVQAAFLEDHEWASDEEAPPPSVSWTPHLLPASEGEHVLILPTGPADTLESCSLFFMEAICSAQRRLWIATPYFVPDDAITKALQLAACRGVDVRIMIPKRSDNLLVKLAGLSYLEDMDMPDIQTLRYCRGFMHKKAILVDDKLAAVGTANLDNRSFRLNFEIGALVAGESFAKELEAMFLEDFRHCSRLRYEDYLRRSWAFKVCCQAARLLSPVL